MIGIFYGSDTGNTENVAKIIYQNIGINNADIFNIAESNPELFNKYNILILGISTWYYGEAQSDWNNFLPQLNNINFNNKKVALFGCGDQEDYSEYFCDAIRLIYNSIISKGANIGGYWPTDDYYFNSSKSLINEKYFMGLTIDQDRQPEKTNKRILNWIKQLYEEFNLIKFIR